MKTDYPVAWTETWALYPKRRDNPQRTAFKAWLARVNSGVAIEDLKQATRNYADECRRKGKEGTEFVLMAQTFYGPNKRYEAYLVPETPVAAPQRVSRGIPRRDPFTEEERREGLVSIRSIIESLARAKVSPVKNLKVTEE